MVDLTELDAALQRSNIGRLVALGKDHEPPGMSGPEVFAVTVLPALINVVREMAKELDSLDQAIVELRSGR